MSLEVKLVCNFLIYLAQKLHQALQATQMTFEIAFPYISIHCEKYSSVHFCTRRHVLNFL